MSPDTAALRRRIERMLRAAPAGLLALTACESPSQVSKPQVVEVGLGLGPAEAETHEHDEGDHDAEEKARCPFGSWCGEPKAAKEFAVPTDPLQLGCPPRLVPHPENGVDPLDARFEGLSLSIDMRATLSRKQTLAERDSGGTRCCYDWIEHCVGRPYVDEASLAHAPGFSRSSDEGGEPRRHADRVRWARSLVADASDELASVASFSRLVLELMAAGAPPRLVAEAHRAALDELRHARRCLDLAERELGHRPTLGVLPALAPRENGLGDLASSTLFEGCLGEGAAAIIGAREASRAPTPEARQVLAKIAEDEGRHALESWRLLGWACRASPSIQPALQVSLERTLGRLRGRPPRATDSVPFRMSPAERRSVVYEVARDLVGPCLEALG